MTDPIKDENNAAAVPVVPPVPAKEEQPASGADLHTGGSSSDAKTVPLPALQEERGKRQAETSRADDLAREVAELRQQVSQTQAYQQQPQQPVPQVDPREEMNKVWEEDPRKAVSLEIMHAMDWRDRVDTGLEQQADALASKYPDFNNYRSTSLAQVRSLPLNQRGSQGILEAAYFMVRGQNADTMIQQRETELLEKYRRGEIDAQGLSTPPGSFSTPAVDTSSQATDEQARVASAMGLSTEDYMSAVVNK